jgi:phage-related protein
MPSSLKPVIWLGSSLSELKTFPAAVQDEMGYAVYLAQCGQKHVSAKPLKGLGSGVVEVVSDQRGDTFRSVWFDSLIVCLCCTRSRRSRRVALRRRRRIST